MAAADASLTGNAPSIDVFDVESGGKACASGKEATAKPKSESK